MKEKGYKKNETCEGVKIFLKVILKKKMRRPTLLVVA